MGVDVAAETGVGDLVDRLAVASVTVAENAMRDHGFCVPLTVHMLSELLPEPWLGWVASRRFYRGRDAAAATRAMGVLPAALGASRLLLTWEHADLCTALELPDEGPGGFPTGQVVLDAYPVGGHLLRWYPFRMHPGPAGPSGFATVVPEWGPPSRTMNGPLPVPVVELLESWREGHDPRAASSIHDEMVAAGYTVQLVAHDAR